jgi:hypothetical protein
VTTFSRYRERYTPNGTIKNATIRPVGVKKTYSAGVLQSTNNVFLTGVGPSGLYEKTWDQNNAKSASKGRRGSRTFRTGGPFVSIKVSSSALSPMAGGTYTSTFGSLRKVYTGGLGFNPFTALDPISQTVFQQGGSANLKANSFVDDTSGYESRAWDIKPKIERVSALNALYEFKDVPGQLRQTARFFKDLFVQEVGGSYARRNILMPDRVAEDYLNVQFGWIPFCNDIASMTDYVIFSKQYLDSIKSGNDAWQKRSGTLADMTFGTKLGKIYTPGCEPLLSDMCETKSVDGNLCTGTCEVWSEETIRVWAEGAFKYYRPEFDVNLPYYGSTVAAVNRHLTATGLRLTPYHVWKAIPWSWAVDWFSNVGRIIEHNDAISLDGMVTKYLYLMHHHLRKITSFHTYFFPQGATTLSNTRFVDVKQRQSGFSPYGFVLGGDLSATQWSILGALGLSHNVKFAR